MSVVMCLSSGFTFDRSYAKALACMGCSQSYTNRGTIRRPECKRGSEL